MFNQSGVFSFPSQKRAGSFGGFFQKIVPLMGVCFAYQLTEGGEGGGAGDTGNNNSDAGGDGENNNNDYLNYEFGGYKYNKNAYDKLMDHGFQAGAKSVEKKIIAGEHDKIKPLTPELEEKLKLADKIDDYKKEIKALKEDKSDEVAKNTIHELEVKLKTAGERHKEQVETIKGEYDKQIGELNSQMTGMIDGIKKSQAMAFISPELDFNRYKNDPSYKYGVQGLVNEIANSVMVKGDIITGDFELVAFEMKDDVPVPIHHVVKGEEKGYKTIQLVAEEIIARADSIRKSGDKSGMDMRIYNNQGTGRSSLFQNKSTSSRNYERREVS